MPRHILPALAAHLGGQGGVRQQLIIPSANRVSSHGTCKPPPLASSTWVCSGCSFATRASPSAMYSTSLVGDATSSIGTGRIGERQTSAARTYANAWSRGRGPVKTISPRFLAVALRHAETRCPLGSRRPRNTASRWVRLSTTLRKAWTMVSRRRTRTIEPKYRTDGLATSARAAHRDSQQLRADTHGHGHHERRLVCPWLRCWPACRALHEHEVGAWQYDFVEQQAGDVPTQP